MSSVLEAAPNGRIVGRYARGNVLVGVHLLVFESARFTLEASAAVNAESREHLSLPEVIPDASKVPVECRYLLSTLNRPKFIKLVVILVQFPFPEGSQSIIKHALSNESSVTMFRRPLVINQVIGHIYRRQLPVRTRAHLGAILACIIDYEL